MKKLIKITLIGLIMFSCKTHQINKSEMDKFSIRNDTILYYNKPVAVFTNLEWEYYRGKKTMEISISQLHGGADSLTDKLVDFIRYKHPKSKAEVKIPQNFN